MIHMITKEQVSQAKSLLYQVVNQAMARGLFNNLDDMPVILDALKLYDLLFLELEATRSADYSYYGELQKAAAEVLQMKAEVEQLKTQSSSHGQ